MTLAPGLYDTLLTDALRDELDRDVARVSSLDPGEAHVHLARHVAGVVERALMSGRDVADKAALIDTLLGVVAQFEAGAVEGERVRAPERLAQVGTRDVTGQVRFRDEPVVGVGESAFITNVSDAPRIGALLASELDSTDRVDAIVAFVKLAGRRVLQTPLEAYLARGGTLRLLTTTYLGASEKAAIDWLHERGAQVRVSYETETTRLHAKAWLFHRNTGANTGYVGSSNLSRAALIDGLEWNVRISARQVPHLIASMTAAFETFWASDRFAPYDPDRDGERLTRALHTQSSAGRLAPTTVFDIEARPFQRRLLDALEVERTRHGRTKNLLVAATGTGKTVMAALDYARLRRQHGPLRLLFVAHRREILEQALTTYRGVLRDGSFGELHVGASRATRWEHVFASIQSLQRLDIEPDAFDVVVVDEFHHATAPTWDRLLSHIQPRYLLGLTATPERSDGASVLRWFDGRTAAELRLWDALDEGVLAPFQYYATHDNTDLSGLDWQRGGYRTDQLSNVYTGNHARVALVLTALRERVPDLSTLRAIGFCVSVEHARFMAACFVRAGIAAEAITGESPEDERRTARTRLDSGKLQAVFTVDLYNEGVDVPSANTLLFLRPTESPTLFLQQLGRGLRRHPGKAGCVVLDFVGRPHASFRYDVRYRALLGASRSQLKDAVEQGFPLLPPGCHLEMDRVARDLVLQSVKRGIASSFPRRVDELRQVVHTLGRVPTLGEFIEHAMLSLDDVYASKRSWSEHLIAAGCVDDPSDGSPARRTLGRLVHADDEVRTARWRAWLEQPAPPDIAALAPDERRVLLMLHANLHANRAVDDWQAALRTIWDDALLRREVVELLEHLDDAAQQTTHPLDPSRPDPTLGALRVHGEYTRDEIVAAYDAYDPLGPKLPREGVWYHEPGATDVFFVTLHKTEQHFSPATRYADYPLSPTLFHWQTQHTTTPGSTLGRRYIEHEARGGRIHLFVRTHRKNQLGLAAPYVFLGDARYVRHEGSRPVSIVWALDRPMPPSLFEAGKVAAG